MNGFDNAKPVWPLCARLVWPDLLAWVGLGGSARDGQSGVEVAVAVPEGGEGAVDILGSVVEVEAALQLCADAGGTFVKLARTIEHYRPLILNTLDPAISDARVAATNTDLRVLTRRASGFHSLDALISMSMLTRGDLWSQLPDRSSSNSPTGTTADPRL